MFRLNAALARLTVAAFLVATLLGSPLALAADVTDIGFIDQNAIAAIPRFAAANRELGAYKSDLDRQFAQQMRRAASPDAQARIAQDFQARFAERQRQILGPLYARAQVAVASVAATKGLSVVVDKRIIIVGGQDITKDVIDLIEGPADPVPPVNTPPPSRVGWIDQSQIDALPKVRAAEQAFAAFQAAQQKSAQAKMRGARTDADRAKIMTDYQNAIAAEQKSTMQPLLDQTRGVVADVARKRNLILVVDRSNIIYGGVDITADVTGAMK